MLSKETGEILKGFDFLEQLAAELDTIPQRSKQTNRDISGILSYPFNRSRRFDFSTGIEQISYNDEVRTTGFDPDAWCIDCHYYKLRRAPKKRNPDEYRY